MLSTNRLVRLGTRFTPPLVATSFVAAFGATRLATFLTASAELPDFFLFERMGRGNSDNHAKDPRTRKSTAYGPKTEPYGNYLTVR